MPQGLLLATGKARRTPGSLLAPWTPRSPSAGILPCRASEQQGHQDLFIPACLRGAFSPQAFRRQRSFQVQRCSRVSPSTRRRSACQGCPWAPSTSLCLLSLLLVTRADSHGPADSSVCVISESVQQSVVPVTPSSRREAAPTPGRPVVGRCRPHLRNAWRSFHVSEFPCFQSSLFEVLSPIVRFTSSFEIERRSCHPAT